MSAAESEKVSWRLTFRAVVILTAIWFVFAGVGDINRISCTVCWRDVTAYLFSVFGFVAGTGFAISLTLPQTAKDNAPNGSLWNTRRDCQEGSLWLGVLMVLVAGLSLAS